MNSRVTNLTGRQGGEVITDTTAHTPGGSGKSWHAILVVEEAVIAAIEGNLTGVSNLVGKTLPAGLPLYGSFTSITLTSGTVIAYLE